MELPTVNFSLEEAKRIYDASAQVDKVVQVNGKKIVVEERDMEPTISYIQQYFYVTRGAHFLWEDGKFEYLSDETVRKTYFKRLPKDISKWYFDQNLFIYKVINDVHKPRVSNTAGNRYINLCAGFKWKNKKPYSSFPVETQNKVQAFMDYMLEVLASSDKKVFEYLLKWYASVCQGKKNDALLYFKGIEGIGKSSMSEFFIEYVLGQDICIRAPMSVLTTDNNAILCGKIFVSFLEMPTSSRGQWENISSRLKTMVTEKSLSFCNKYEKCYEAENINNYSIETNVEALKNSNGRRIFIDPISTKRKEDHVYFGKLKEQCYNNEVGEAFFNYLLELDTKDFHAQWHMPETQAKLDAHVESLEVVYQFIKDEHILKSKLIERCTIAEFYAQYEAYCAGKDKKPLVKTKFNSKLAEVNINWKPSHGQKVYKMQLDQLQEIAKKNKWLHILDVVEKTETKSKPQAQYLFENPLENGVKDIPLAIPQEKEITLENMDIVLKRFRDETILFNEKMKKVLASVSALMSLLPIQSPKPVEKPLGPTPREKPILEGVVSPKRAETPKEPVEPLTREKPDEVFGSPRVRTPKKSNSPKQPKNCKSVKKDIEIPVPENEDEMDDNVLDFLKMTS